jgi:cyclopropane-fatty-acyl-phospholipid synthase
MRQWLDPGMVYSCAYFENGDEDLARRSAKRSTISCARSACGPNQTLLDIGCGWGALVIRAAQHYGARCVGVTLSENQARWRASRCARAGAGTSGGDPPAGLPRRARPFDRITSVGMFEHVGMRHLPAYFARIARCSPTMAW